ncbi:MAG TPA: GNAT family N-acetyltransferase [Steroidobacteraceae bacterium]|jgi:hypothetical protein|nr:GNAT family N-acetyltransferase [Steroidobacteraceae bacterium]
MPRPALLPFKQWCAELDEALAQLPDPPGWARTIYPTLAQIAAKHARVRTYLSVDAQGQPEALVTLMSGPRGVWEPITQWIVPGFVGVAKPGTLEPLLARLPVPSRIVWWRMGPPPPQLGYVRRTKSETTYAMHLASDYETHWRQGRFHQTVNRARRRCANLNFIVNAPGAAEYTIRSAATQWTAEDPQSPYQTECRLLLASQLEPEGRHFTFSLMDVDKFVASSTACAVQEDLVGLATTRDRNYQQLDAGTCLIDRIAQWGREKGFKSLDLGGSHDYKKQWGPASGTKSKLYIYPPLSYATHRLTQSVADACRAGISMVSRLRSSS